jgi:3-methylcrotonyl-CoA carboxylase alpha subunit
VLALEESRLGGPLGPWQRLGSWRVVGRAGAAGWTELPLRDEGGDVQVVRVCGSAGRYRLDYGDGPMAVEAWQGDGGVLRFELCGALHRRTVDRADGHLWIAGGVRHRRLAVVSREARAATEEAVGAASDARNLVAPFPGLVTSVEVAPGDRVEPGGLLVVMEAMKMVHSLRAAGAGSVREVYCRAGRTVAAGDLLVELESTSR